MEHEGIVFGNEREFRQAAETLNESINISARVSVEDQQIGPLHGTQPCRFQSLKIEFISAHIPVWGDAAWAIRQGEIAARSLESQDKAFLAPLSL